MFTGCKGKVSDEPFNRDDVTLFISLYGGIQKIDDKSDPNDIAYFFTRLNVPSAYYVSKNKEEAQTVYYSYMNRNNFYPMANLNEMILAVTRETVGDAVYEGECCYFVLDSKDDARLFYESYVDNYMSSKGTTKTGKKDGYAYAIAYSQSANRAGNCDFVKGVYWKGNSILIMSGSTPTGGQETFMDYIFSRLSVLDPITLKYVIRREKLL